LAADNGSVRITDERRRQPDLETVWAKPRLRNNPLLPIESEVCTKTLV
jgi:hypothetical protein